MLHMLKYIAVAMAAACACAFADTITIDGVTHENVYIAESDTRYYVQNPTDGSVFSLEKTEAESVSISPDADLRRALLKQWKEQRGIDDKPAVDAAAPAEEMPEEAQAEEEAYQPTFEEIRERKAIRDLAEFEGDFEYWAMLSPFSKSGVVSKVKTETQKVEASADRKLDVIDQKAEGIEAEKQIIRQQQLQRADRIDTLYDAEREDLSNIYNNPALRHYERMYDRALLWRYYDDYWDIHYPDPPHIPENPHDPHDPHHPGHHWDYNDWRYFYYGNKLDQAYRRTQYEANQTSRAYENERDAERSAIQSLEQQAAQRDRELKKLALEEKRVATVSGQYANTSERITGRLMALSAALEDGFTPIMQKTLVRQWERTGTTKTEKFEITTDLWRIDWATTGSGTIKGRIYSADDDRLVAVFPKQTILNFPYMILEGKGRYYIEVETLSNFTQHYVVVCELAMR